LFGCEANRGDVAQGGDDGSDQGRAAGGVVDKEACGSKDNDCPGDTYRQLATSTHACTEALRSSVLVSTSAISIRATAAPHPTAPRASPQHSHPRPGCCAWRAEWEAITQARTEIADYILVLGRVAKTERPPNMLYDYRLFYLM
jgi:hypothetical protein